MNKLILIVILFSISFLTQEKGSIQLEIKNFDSNNGFVRIALYNNHENYTSKDKAFKTAKLEIKNNIVNYTFEDLPFGEYAIKLFHDENNNEELDTGMFGIPTEDYAFSNNARGFMGPASYEDAKFKLDKKTVKQIMEL